MSANNGGPAFPVMNDENGNLQTGMSLRDYLAGQALAGMNWIDSGKTYADDAEMCYKIADAMLEVRKQ